MSVDENSKHKGRPSTRKSRSDYEDDQLSNYSDTEAIKISKFLKMRSKDRYSGTSNDVKTFQDRSSKNSSTSSSSTSSPSNRNFEQRGRRHSFSNLQMDSASIASLDSPSPKRKLSNNSYASSPSSATKSPTHPPSHIIIDDYDAINSSSPHLRTRTGLNPNKDNRFYDLVPQLSLISLDDASLEDEAHSNRSTDSSASTSSSSSSLSNNSNSNSSRITSPSSRIISPSSSQQDNIADHSKSSPLSNTRASSSNYEKSLRLPSFQSSPDELPSLSNKPSRLNIPTLNLNSNSSSLSSQYPSPRQSTSSIPLTARGRHSNNLSSSNLSSAQSSSSHTKIAVNSSIPQFDFTPTYGSVPSSHGNSSEVPSPSSMSVSIDVLTPALSLDVQRSALSDWSTMQQIVSSHLELSFDDINLFEVSSFLTESSSPPPTPRHHSPHQQSPQISENKRFGCIIKNSQFSLQYIEGLYSENARLSSRLAEVVESLIILEESLQQQTKEKMSYKLKWENELRRRQDQDQKMTHLHSQISELSQTPSHNHASSSSSSASRRRTSLSFHYEPSQYFDKDISDHAATSSPRISSSIYGSPSRPHAQSHPTPAATTSAYSSPASARRSGRDRPPNFATSSGNSSNEPSSQNDKLLASSSPSSSPHRRVNAGSSTARVHIPDLKLQEKTLATSSPPNSSSRSASSSTSSNSITPHSQLGSPLQSPTIASQTEPESQDKSKCRRPSCDCRTFEPKGNTSWICAHCGHTSVQHSIASSSGKASLSSSNYPDLSSNAKVNSSDRKRSMTMSRLEVSTFSTLRDKEQMYNM